jgi:antitoxin ParD1/3/4
MTDLSFSLPDDLARQLKSRIADGHYADAGEYLSALVRRDLEESQKIAWLRAGVAEGLASGIIDKEPEAVIEEIIAARRARHG